jgi:hypothetical protein
MTAVDALGFLASALVLATFCMKRLVPLRTVAITSNVVFITYGYSAGIKPVLLLHVALLPVNVPARANDAPMPVRRSRPTRNWPLRAFVRPMRSL